MSACGRKPHVTVPQDSYLKVMADIAHGGGAGVYLPDIAAYLGVHEATARRKLDGLVAQGKLNVTPGVRGPEGHPRYYTLAHALEEA